jgi:outer membrane lipoprotein SlyB
VRRVRPPAGRREVVEQAAGGAVGGVHGAEEAPGLGKQLAHGGGSQLRKVGAAVDGAEVGQVPEQKGRKGEGGGLCAVLPRHEA